MIVGFIVNKFRGDASLFEGAMATIAERTGWRALGLVPFFAAARAPAGGRRVRPWRGQSPRRRPASRSPCRCSRASPISTISIRCAWSLHVRLVFVRPGEPLPRRRSRHPARQQGDDRRSRLLSRSRAGTSISSPMRGAAGGCSESAAAIRCSGRSVADPDGIEGPARRGRGPWPARRRDRADRRKDACARSRASASPTARRFAATRCMSAGRRARIAPGRFCASPTGALDGATSRERPASPAPMCTACSPTTASARRGSLRSARDRRSPTRRRSSARSTSSPIIARRISTSTRSSGLRDERRAARAPAPGSRTTPDRA